MKIWDTNLCVETSPGSIFLENIVNWSDFQKNCSNGVGLYSLVVYIGVLYRNLTGDITETSPDLDDINWEQYPNGGSGDVSSVFSRIGHVVSEDNDYTASQIANIPEGSIIGTDLQTVINTIQNNNPELLFQIDLSTNPSYNEGLLFYDNTKKALSYYNENTELTLNIGQEVLFRVENQSGETIPNGSVVVLSSSNTIELAYAKEKDKSRLIYVMTHDILDGGTGYATKLGQVGNLDTSAYDVGTVLYLSAETYGAFTDIRPEDGAYSIIIGIVTTQDESDGIITVDTRSSDLTVEVTDTNGFPSTESDNITLSMEDTTRTFSIVSSSYPFHYYVLGDKFDKDESESIILPNTEGLKAIYYDNDTLSFIDNPTNANVATLITTMALVAYVYWDFDNQEHNYFGNELHSISMAPSTHSYLHFTQGAKYLSGLALNNVLADDDGDDDESAMFGVESGIYTDEDLVTFSVANLSTVGLPIYYIEGSEGYLRRSSHLGFSMLTDIDMGIGTTGRLIYNEYTGSDWQLTTIINNDYVLCHIFAINGISTEDRIIAIMGQEEYSNRSNARSGAEIEISQILLQLPVQEIIPIATLIFQTSDGYDNEIKARVVSSDDSDYVDWRQSDLIAGAAASSHNNLADLNLTGSDVTWGHVSSTEPLNLPIFTTTERDALSPSEGGLIYNLTTKVLEVFNGTNWV